LAKVELLLGWDAVTVHAAGLWSQLVGHRASITQSYDYQAVMDVAPVIAAYLFDCDGTIADSILS
jgi:hypothetical protein